MSRIDDILGNAAMAVDTAVQRMPEREVRTVETRSTRKSALTGVGALVALVVVGLLGWVLLGGGGGDVGPIDDPEGAPTTIAADPVLADPNAAAWPASFQGEPGTYGASLSGQPFSFDLEEVGGRVPWALMRRSPWEVGLLHPDAREIGDRELVFMVAERLSDPETLRDPTWPVGDIEGWLDAVAPGVLVEGPTDVVVAGRAAVRFTMKSQAPCEDIGPGDVAVMPCDTLAFTAEGTGGQLFIETSFAEVEVWWVPHPDGDSAFVAFAAAYSGSWNSWGPIVEGVIDSLGIGE